MTFGEWRVVLKLAASYARLHPKRMLLTLLATVAAAGVVVWVVSGYDSLLKKFDEFADKYLGRYDLLVMPVPPEGQTGGGMFAAPLPLPPEYLAALRAESSLAFVDPITQARIRLEKVTGEPLPEEPAPEAAPPPRPGVPAFPGRNRRPVPQLVGTDAKEPPYKMAAGKWPQGAALEAALSQGTAEKWKVKVGDEVQATYGREEGVTLKIVGLVEQRKQLPSTGIIIGLPASKPAPLPRRPADDSLYVSSTVAAQVLNAEPKTNYVYVKLKEGVNADDFKKNFAAKMTGGPLAQLQTLADVEGELENSVTTDTVKSQAYSATGISLLAAIFIIFTTLSMGVDERVRQLAILRAVALTRAQVAALIVLESLLLGLIGWLGGLAAGWAVLEITQRWKPDLFPVGTSLGWMCIILSGVCAAGGALAASILPAWKATRVRPLEAAVTAPRGQSARYQLAATIAGLILLVVNPLVVFYLPLGDTMRYPISAAIGCTTMAVGFILLAPAAVTLAEKICGPMLALLLGLDARLLQTQLTANLWRSVGTTIALTLGLGLYLAMYVWGHSMMGPFLPGKWTPDLIVGLMNGGIPDAAVAEVKNVRGVRADRCLPLASQQVKFSDDPTGSKLRSSSSRQDNCVLLGVDPEAALGGADPLFDFEYLSGSREEAIRKLKLGRYCLVPDHFERESNLHVGDKFGVLAPNSKEKIEYEIAGVVSMTGWHWMSKVGVRNAGGGRSAGLMFTSFDQVRADFKIERVSFLWMDTDGTATEDELKESFAKIAAAHPGPRRGGFGGRGRLAGGDAAAEPDTGEGPAALAGAARGTASGVNLRSAEGVRTAIRERAAGIFQLLSRFPLVTLFVTSLGVINTILASVRARRWDLGVLRAVGLTRFALFRLIIAEALLIAAAACLLSLGLGITAGLCGTGVTRYTNVRGGQMVQLVVPWGQVLFGFALTLGLCLLAAAWPAISTGRTEPLKLLQAGRSAV